MPTYQYVCTECATPLEVVQSFTDEALTECPTCGGRLRKVFSAVGVVFKGSGFYRTDSRETSSSNGSKDSTKRTETSSSPGAIGSDPGSAAKPAAAASSTTPSSSSTTPSSSSTASPSSSPSSSLSTS